MTTYVVVITGPDGSGRRQFIDAVADIVIDDSGYLAFTGDLNLQLNVRNVDAPPGPGVVLGTVLLLPTAQPIPEQPHRPIIAVAPTEVSVADATLHEPSLDRAVAKRILISLLDLAATGGSA